MIRQEKSKQGSLDNGDPEAPFCFGVIQSVRELIVSLSQHSTAVGHVTFPSRYFFIAAGNSTKRFGKALLSLHPIPDSRKAWLPSSLRNPCPTD